MSALQDMLSELLGPTHESIERDVRVILKAACQGPEPDEEDLQQKIAAVRGVDQITVLMIRNTDGQRSITVCMWVYNHTHIRIECPE